MAPEISLYFPHAGKGQTVLIRMMGNSWIVVDAHPVGGRNPAVEILQEHSRQEGFRLLAVVISHLHLDHYLGMPQLFDFGLTRGCLEKVLVPAPYAFFQGLLQAGGSWSIKGVKRLYEYLRPEGVLARRTVEVASIRCPALCWRPFYGALDPTEPWVFALHPDAASLLEALGRDFGRETAEPKNGRVSQDSLQRNANHHSTVLSVGHGKADRHLHFLLPADLPGRRFQELTESFRRETDGAQPRRAGVNEDLLRIRSSGRRERLRPLCGMAVAHHGSENDPLRASDLSWWLTAGRKRSPPIAIVQGDRRALGEETVKILAQAGCRIFASALPARLLKEDDLYPRSLQERLPLPPRRSASEAAPYTIQSGTHRHPDGAEVGACLVVHGGGGGVQAIAARNFYEIDVERKSVIPHVEASWECVCP